MKAFIIERYGKSGRVLAADMPDPELRDNDVLVQIHAASVNPVDIKLRNGEFKLVLPYRLPLILGNDLAGVVVRVGSRVRRFKPTQIPNSTGCVGLGAGETFVEAQLPTTTKDRP